MITASAATTMPRQTATYADLAALPDHVVGEILDGELVTSPRPLNRHAFIITALGSVLFDPYGQGLGGPGGWLFLSEPEIRLGGDVLVPDLAGWRWENAPADEVGTYFSTAPDWACEILSPKTVRHDRGAKLRIYHRNQVGHVWLIDPQTQVLEVYDRAESAWSLLRTFHHDEPVTAPPFEAAPFPLDRLWLRDPRAAG